GPPENYDLVTSLAYGDGAFLAGTYNGLLWRSVDGTNWAQLTPQGNGFLGGITFGPDLAVAVGGWEGQMLRPPAATILTSSDGIDWQKMVDSTSWMLTAVAYGNGFYVAVDSQGTIHSSEDGSCWFPRFNSQSCPLKGIAFGRGVFVAVGENGTILRSVP